MVARVKTIAISADSETARLLQEAVETPAIFVVNGARYRVLREPVSPNAANDDIWEDYDPQRAIDGMLAAAGSISEEEGERWIENIYRWRREGSRPVEPS